MLSHVNSKTSSSKSRVYCYKILRSNQRLNKVDDWLLFRDDNWMNRGQRSHSCFLVSFGFFFPLPCPYPCSQAGRTSCPFYRPLFYYYFFFHFLMYLDGENHWYFSIFRIVHISFNDDDSFLVMWSETYILKSTLN